jgi:hypothetical protein
MPANQHTNPQKHAANRLHTNDARLLLSSLVVLLCSIFIINAMYIMSHSKNTSALDQAKPVAGIVLSSQQTAKTPALTASVSSVSEDNRHDPAFTLDDTQTMLVATLSITNNTSSAQDFLPANQLYVRAHSGEYSQMHPSMFLTNPIAAGKINPGQTIKGQISFGVPKSEPHPLLYIDTLWNNQVPTVFDILK